MSQVHHRIIRSLGLKKQISKLVDCYYSFRFSTLRVRRGTPVLVYQMGKVGSRTIVETLLVHLRDRPVYHVHFLTDDGLEFDRRKSDQLGRAYPGRSYWAGIYIQRYIERNIDGPLDVIVLTRDPVARNLSAFFHSIDYWYPDHQKILSKDTYSEDDLQRIKDEFIDKYPHERPVYWFDQELENVFGIDIYQFEFPQKTGYQIIENMNTRALVLKLEGLNENYRTAFKDFFERDFSDVDLIGANISGERKYYQLYQSFLDWLVLPENYLDQMYNSQYAKHFYSPDELSKFTEFWLKTYHGA